jgi:hypothetical protein
MLRLVQKAFAAADLVQDPDVVQFSRENLRTEGGERVHRRGPSGVSVACVTGLESNDQMPIMLQWDCPPQTETSLAFQGKHIAQKQWLEKWISSDHWSARALDEHPLALTSFQTASSDVEEFSLVARSKASWSTLSWLTSGVDTPREQCSQKI